MLVDDQRSEEIAHPWKLDEESSDDESKRESRSQIGHLKDAGKLLTTFKVNDQNPNVLLLD